MLWACSYRLVKDLREEQQEDGAKEVKGSDGDIEGIRLLVHVWPHDGDTNKERCLDDNESNGLCGTVALCETNEHGFHKRIGQDRNDEVVHGCPELDIEKAPLVKSNRIRVQNVSGVLVHDNRALGDANDLGRCPSQDSDHGDDGEYSEDNLTGRVAPGQFPEAENHHLRETDENDTEQDALQNRTPSVTEVGELIVLHFTSLDETFANVLEGDNTKHDEDDEDDEEGVAGKEDVGGLNLGLETDSFDTVQDNIGLVRNGIVIGVCTALEVGHGIVEAVDSPLGHGDGVQAALDFLLHFDGNVGQLLQVGGRGATGCTLVPGSHSLQETNTDDTHAPLEVLGPCSNDRRERYGAHAKESLGLEVAEERHGVGSDVGSRVRVTQSRGDGGYCETQTGDDSGNPGHSLLIDGVAVGQLSLDAANLHAGCLVADLDAHDGIEIGDGVGDAGNLTHDVGRNVYVGIYFDVSGVHGTHALDVVLLVAGV